MLNIKSFQPFKRRGRGEAYEKQKKETGYFRNVKYTLVITIRGVQTRNDTSDDIFYYYTVKSIRD